jgi:Fe-S cluster assembly iron-binding protein IscA
MLPPDCDVTSIHVSDLCIQLASPVQQRQIFLSPHLQSVSFACKVMSASAAATTARSALRRPRPACLQVSEEAAARIRALVAKRHPPPAGVRVGVRTRGCNGMSYTMDYADAPGKFDERVELPRVAPDSSAAEPTKAVTEKVHEEQPSVFVDPRALIHIVGTRMHFIDNDLVSEFVFENPNAKGTCGCGESFNV